MRTFLPTILFATLLLCSCTYRSSQIVECKEAGLFVSFDTNKDIYQYGAFSQVGFGLTRETADTCDNFYVKYQTYEGVQLPMFIFCKPDSLYILGSKSFDNWGQARYLKHKHINIAGCETFSIPVFGNDSLTSILPDVPIIRCFLSDSSYYRIEMKADTTGLRVYNYQNKVITDLTFHSSYE